MKSIEIYQHPFVDILNQFKVADWTTSHKEGDV
jgi:hypothetical protein